LRYIWSGYFLPMAFDKVGLRQKYLGHDWEEPYVRHEVPLLDRDLLAGMKRYEAGEPVARSELPTASTVYDAKCFARQKPLSRAGICYIAHEPLADLLSRFDMGPGGVTLYTIYENDETTPYGENWSLLGLGAQKQSFLPLQSRTVETLVAPTDARAGLYSVPYEPADDDYACSAVALDGADMWAEAGLRRAFFYSAALGAALIEAGYGETFGLNRVRIED
jgi:hypothetical protein